jgi:hypothetical protein
MRFAAARKTDKAIKPLHSSLQARPPQSRERLVCFAGRICGYARRPSVLS